MLTGQGNGRKTLINVSLGLAIAGFWPPVAARPPVIHGRRRRVAGVDNGCFAAVRATGPFAVALIAPGPFTGRGIVRALKPQAPRVRDDHHQRRPLRLAICRSRLAIPRERELCVCRLWHIDLSSPCLCDCGPRLGGWH